MDDPEIAGKILCGGKKAAPWFRSITSGIKLTALHKKIIRATDGGGSVTVWAALVLWDLYELL